MGQPEDLTIQESLDGGAVLNQLLPGQMDLLEAQLARQEAAMQVRQSATATRSAVLIGASAVLAGAELVSATNTAWLAGASLTLYLLAALLGLASARSRRGREPDLPQVIREYAPNKTISMRRELLLGRLTSHDTAVAHLNDRHRLLVWGFFALAGAWVLAASGTVWSLGEEPASPPTEIRIVE